MSKQDYPTDEFGRPDGRNYTYKIPLNNDAATFLASRHIRGRTDRFVTRLKDHDGDDLYHMVIQTQDNKGPLDGLSKHQYSQEWEKPFRHSRANWEVRRANKGGTKIRGTFSGFDEAGYEKKIPFDTVVDFTLGEVKDIASGEADEEIRQQFEEEIHWVHEEAMDEHRERVHEEQMDCNHDHFVNFEDVTHGVPESPDAIGYCEDCGAEVDDEGNVVGGRTM